MEDTNLVAQYHLDNLVLVESIVITPEFLSAEPLANNVIAVTTKGEVDLSAVTVSLNGAVSDSIGIVIPSLTWFLSVRRSQWTQILFAT